MALRLIEVVLPETEAETVGERLDVEVQGGPWRVTCADGLACVRFAVDSEDSGRVVFVIPGSRGAVRLAMEKLIVPEIGHLAGEGIGRLVAARTVVRSNGIAIGNAVVLGALTEDDPRVLVIDSVAFIDNIALVVI